VPVPGTPTAVSRSSIVATAWGDAARVVVRCTPRAAGACTISLLLSMVETERGGHVVGVSARVAAARTPARGHPRPPRITRRTVIVGSQPVTLTPGEVRVVPVPLNALGRQLLAREHRLPVLVSANGTLVGAVSASLGSTLLTLHPTRGTPATHSVSAPTAPPVLAATPYMGWDTYFAFGGAFNEATILDQAHQLIARGLARAGYRYIWFDVGWWHGTRDATGQITVSPAQWPHGLAWLTGILHQAGFLVGLYTDAGVNGCGGPGAGSYGHYQQDVNTFAAWGFDAVKVDFCGGVRQGLDPQSTYTAFHNAIANNASHRPMLLNVCNFLQPGQFAAGTPNLAGSGFDSWAFAPSIANSWRTDTDVGSPHHVDFANVLRNLDADAAHPQAAGPGHWNDPDYLGPDQGLTPTAYRTQLSMWSMLAAPLMISDDLDTMTAQSASDSANPEVIAIDQDPAGVQATLVASAGSAEVWVKPLSDGSRAVALLNRGGAAMRISATAVGVGLSHASRYTVRDVWAHRTATTSGAITAVVPAEGTALYRISAVPAARR
jgi:alpha-galactosidase